MTKQFEAKNIADASPAELRDFAATFLGIPVADDTDSQVLAKIKAAHEGETIFVRSDAGVVDQTGSAPPQVEAPSGGGLVGGLGHEDPKVSLTLHAEERDGVITSRHKEVGVNGVVWLLKRGIPLDVPYRVYLALNNAERTNITHDSEGNEVRQTVKNTPFNVHRMPPQEEIDAWMARTADVFVPA